MILRISTTIPEQTSHSIPMRKLYDSTSSAAAGDTMIQRSGHNDILNSSKMSRVNTNSICLDLIVSNTKGSVATSVSLSSSSVPPLPSPVRSPSFTLN